MSSLTPAGIQYIVEGFSQGLSQLSQLDKAQQSLGKSGSQLGGQFASLGQSALGAGAIMGGVALAGVTALAGGLVYLGTQALESYAKYERMSLSIQNLVAREISQGKEQLVQKREMAQLTAAETAEIASLQQKLTDEALDRNTLAASIQEQRQRVIDLTASYGENGLNVQTAKARLAEMENELGKSDAAAAKMTQRIADLNAKNGQLVTVTEKVRTGQMSMKEAMAQAGPEAKNLLDWISKLAIASPFDQAGIALAFKTAMTYGFTTEKAVKLTEAMVDFAAATGSSIDSAQMIALALGQMQAKGKVSGQELIQLTNAGIGVNAILNKLGFTLDDVSKGLVGSDKFIEAVVADMEVFKGAAKDQASTFSGLLTSLEELKSVGLREFFAGTFQAIQPYLANFVDLVTQPETFDALRGLGEVLGGAVSRGMQNFIALVKGLQSAFAKGGVGGVFAAMGITPDIMVLFTLIGKSITDLAAVVSGQLTPAFNSFQGIIPTINSLITFLVQNFDSIKGAFIGISAVVGVGVFAALASGLLALLTPINLIIAGVALLGAAWVGNWGDIQGKFAEFVAFWQAQWPLIQAVALTAWQVLQSVWAGIVAAITPAFQSIQQAFNNLTVAMASVGITWGDVGNALLTAVGYVMAGIGVAIVAVISIITSFVTAWASAIQTASTWIMTLKTNIETIMTGIVQAFSGAFQLVQGILNLNSAQILSGWTLMTQGITNIVTGLAQTIGNIFMALGATVNSFMTGFVSSMIAFWQNLYMTLVGGSIVPEMAAAIINTFTMMVNAITTLLSTAAQPIIDVFNTISTTVRTIMSNLFSGVGTVTLDLTTLTTILPQAILTNINLISQMFSLLTNINLLISTTLPTSLKSFRDTAVQVFDEMITKLTEIEVKFSIIQSAILSMQIVIQTLSTIAAIALGILNAALIETVGKFNALKDAAENAASASKGVSDTAGGYDKLKKAIDDITKAFEKMTTAAEDAGRASSAAANSGTTATGGATPPTGISFAAGTPLGNLGLGFKIPAGYPNDSFGPMYAQSGEEMLISPRGTSIEDLISRRLSSLSIPRQQPIINVYTGDINNGMDLSILENFITTTVANSFA